MIKKIQILNAAAKVFYQQGASKAKFGDIAKEAGISRPTLYTFFKDKNAITIAAAKYKYKKIPIWSPLKPQKSVFINRVKLLSRPHEIDSVKLPKKNKINDLFEIAIFSSDMT